jgi:hypothetical protein
MTFPRPPALLLAVLFAAGPARALDWPHATVETRAEPWQKTLALVFAFRNGGPHPVHILDLQTSCSCLAADSDKKVYAPGEAGQLTARFTVDERSGIYERSITVLTDESAPPQRLTVRIEVPELVTLAPRSLEWKTGEAGAEKFVELHLDGALHIRLTAATPSNGSFSARLETIVPEQVYRLAVVPRLTTAVANAAVRIAGHDEAGHDILVSAYADVR